MPGDDEVDRPAPPPDPAGAAARSMTQLAQQMKEMADRMLGAGLPGWPVPGAAPARAAATEPADPTPREAARPPSVPGLPPMPATMSARQLQSVVDDIAAKRAQVRALIAQLEVFDEQLGGLESSLQPLLTWLQTWSDLEGAVTDFWTPRPPGGQGRKR